MSKTITEITAIYMRPCSDPRSVSPNPGQVLPSEPPACLFSDRRATVGGGFFKGNAYDCKNEDACTEKLLQCSLSCKKDLLLERFCLHGLFFRSGTVDLYYW